MFETEQKFDFNVLINNLQILSYSLQSSDFEKSYTYLFLWIFFSD